jgi:hypothetical protein
MTKLFEVALIALRPACDADLPSMMNHLVRETDPAILGQHVHQFLFHPLRCVGLG